MRKQRTHFDKAFKENAVKLSLERKNVSELAQELGIAPFLLYRWRKEFQQKGEASFPGTRINHSRKVECSWRQTQKSPRYRMSTDKLWQMTKVAKEYRLPKNHA